MNPEPDNPTTDTTLYNEVQVILAGKQTSLSTLRTGIAAIID